MYTQASASLPPLDVSYEDDPLVLEQAANEDYSRATHHVPPPSHMNPLSLTVSDSWRCNSFKPLMGRGANQQARA